jgi:hypothetical protein
MAGEVSQHLSDRIRHRLQGVNLLTLGATDRDLRQALNDLNHRLRYALGEYEKPPSSPAVPE